ncbi:hypothetical protein ACQJBY_014597 [Aegilops geniculata]
MPSSNRPDTRISVIHNKTIRVAQVYELLTFRGVSCVYSSWIWDRIIPLKYRVFLWLLFWGRLNTQDNMMKKQWTSIVTHQDCDICPASESAIHLVLRCCPALVIWNVFGLADLASNSPDLISFVQQAEQRWPATSKFHILFAATAVTTWHARNDRVFNYKRWSSAYVKQYVAQLLRLWQSRSRKQDDKDAIAAWILCLD